MSWLTMVVTIVAGLATGMIVDDVASGDAGTDFRAIFECILRVLVDHIGSMTFGTIRMENLFPSQH